MIRLFKRICRPVIVFATALVLCSFSSFAYALSTFDDGFSGDFYVAALLTTDKNWRKKWTQPLSKPPHLDTETTLKPNQKTRLLIFYRNPKLVGGKPNLDCKVTVSVSDGGRSQLRSRPCAAGGQHSPNLLSLAQYSSEMSFGKSSSLPVFVTVTVTVTDNNSGRVVRLRPKVKVSKR